jgi:hypothetical protein
MHSPFHPPFLFHLLGMVIRILLVTGAAFFLLRYYLDRTRKPVPAASQNEDQKVILSLRLQAFERFVLFLERIHPSNLVMRLNAPDLTAHQLQSLLARTIREEFEYNLSQQLYISAGSWELVKNAKEETIAMINQATARVGQEADSSSLVKEIFELSVSKGKLPVDAAIDGIKTEMQKLF